MDSRTLLRHSQDPRPCAQGDLSCPWLSSCPRTPEPAPLAEHPTRFAQLLTPDPPGQLRPARPCQAGRGTGQLSPWRGTAGRAEHGRTDNTQLCKTPAPAPEGGSDPRTPPVPGQHRGVSPVSPPAGQCHRQVCLPIKGFFLHGLPQLALVLLPQAAELVPGAELGRGRVGELHLEGRGGEIDLGQSERVRGPPRGALGGGDAPLECQEVPAG